jgi:replication-associated recombination protein RarA
MTKEQILARIDDLLTLCAEPREGRVQPEHVFNGALTLMTSLYGGDSHQVDTLLQRRADIARTDKVEGVRRIETILAVQGALGNLRQEVQADLLTSLEHRIASDVLSDLVQLARVVLQEAGDGPKNVAAVLVAAAYEDTIRRIAKEHAGVIGQDKLDTVIGKLKDAGLLVAPQLGIALGYLNFRNRALHAEWENIDRTSVTSALAFVEELLLKRFA